MSSVARVLLAAGTLSVLVACTGEPSVAPVFPSPVGEASQSITILPPPDASSGLLQLCKVAGAGIAAGTTFPFDVSLLGVIRSGDVAAGSCLPLPVPRAATPYKKGTFAGKGAEVQSLVPTGVTLRIDNARLTSAQLLAVLNTAPGVQAPSALVLNLGQQLLAAQLNVLRGVQPSPSVLQAIASANAGISVSVGSAIVVSTSLNTSAQGALVNTLTNFNEGKPKPPVPPPNVQLLVTEGARSDTKLTAIDCQGGGGCTATDVNGRSTVANVTSGQTTLVSFTNRSTLGTLHLCKVAGAGLVAGSSYDYQVAGATTTQSASVASGACKDVTLAEGSYDVTETIPANQRVEGIVCSPSQDCGTSDLAAGKVPVTLSGGATTTVTYTNRSTITTVHLCKVGGANVGAGRSYRFRMTNVSDLSKVNQTVASGSCADVTLVEGSYRIDENVPAGETLDGISCTPQGNCGTVDLTAGYQDVALAGGDIVTVAFTNSRQLATVSICNAGGTGIAAGTPYTYHVYNTTGGPGEPDLSVGAGECKSESVTAGVMYQILQVTPSTQVTTDITCSPTNYCSGIDTKYSTNNVAVDAGQSVSVTYTNRVVFGTLRICQATSISIPAGTSYHYLIADVRGTGNGTSTDVASGSCVDVSVKEGSYQVIQRPLPAGEEVSITCGPAANCGAIDEPTGSLFVLVNGADLTTVNVTNTIKLVIGSDDD